MVHPTFGSSEIWSDETKTIDKHDRYLQVGVGPQPVAAARAIATNSFS